jgi:hypothetical protein
MWDRVLSTGRTSIFVSAKELSEKAILEAIEFTNWDQIVDSENPDFHVIFPGAPGS